MAKAVSLARLPITSLGCCCRDARGLTSPAAHASDDVAAVLCSLFFHALVIDGPGMDRSFLSPWGLARSGSLLAWWRMGYTRAPLRCATRGPSSLLEQRTQPLVPVRVLVPTIPTQSRAMTRKTGCKSGFFRLSPTAPAHCAPAHGIRPAAHPAPPKGGCRTAMSNRNARDIRQRITSSDIPNPVDALAPHSRRPARRATTDSSRPSGTDKVTV